MKNFWKYISAFLSGVIAGILVYLRLKKADIQADTYIEDQEQKIGKIKQKGEANNQDVDALQSIESKTQKRQNRKEARQAKRAERKAARAGNKAD